MEEKEDNDFTIDKDDNNNGSIVNDDASDSEEDDDVFNYDEKRSIEKDVRRIRTFTKCQEIANLILLLGSIALTVFVAFGILSLGILGTVVLGTITFVLLSYFMGTYILTCDYCRIHNGYMSESVSLVKEESIINTFMRLLKFKILPVVFLCLGITLVTFANMGIIGLGLGLGLGVPSIVVTVFPFMHFIIKANSNNKSRYYTERCCRKCWKIMICTMGCTLGLATTVTLFALCIVGTLTWTVAIPTALFAFASAIVSLSCVMSNNLLEFRTVLEEISNPAMFFGGIGINSLISFGILPFGTWGIGICAMFIFIGASRFIFTNTLTAWHNVGIRWDRQLGKQLGDYAASDKYYKFSNGLVNSKITDKYMGFIKRAIFPIVAILTGIGMIYKIGFFGFGLSLGIGIPLLALALPYVPWLIARAINLKTYMDVSNNYWVTFVGIIGFITAVIFPILSVTGVLVWESAIAFGAPTVIFATLTVLLNLGIKLFEKKYDDEKDSLKNNLKGSLNKISKQSHKPAGIKLIYNNPYEFYGGNDEK